MSVVIQQANAVNPNVNLSPSAIKHVVSYLAKNEMHRGIRLSVKKSGCSGYSYVVDYVQEPKEGDLILHLSGDYLIYIDKTSYPLLQGMQIDYVKQGLNSKFVFTNPNQTGQCGCGESFTIS